MIEVRDVKKWIQNGSRKVEILKGISLSIPSGQFVAIVGASGSGKSTLLGLLAGLDTPSEGEIWIDGLLSITWSKQNWRQCADAKSALFFSPTS